MAITLPQIKISVNLANIVDAAIEVVQAERRKETARVEAEFQKAIADGLSYDEQIRLREQHLQEEKSSSFSDETHVMKLEKSIADIKKLARFNRYRERYANILGELSSGRINEQQYLNTLKSSLNGVADPDLRLEIQNNISEAEGMVKQYRDTILTNQVKKAKFDGTSKVLDEVLASVKNARVNALISDNQDEVTAYDETISSLESQLSTVRIQDSLTDFQVKSSTRGTSPVEKLNFINDEISRANPNQPIKIGDRTYNSAQEFWSLERDGYLNGSSQIFGDFFNELKTHTKNTVDANTLKFGYPIQSVLNDVNNTLVSLGSRTEMQPYLNKFDVTKAVILADAVDKTANKIVESSGYNPDLMKKGVTQLQQLQQRYGIDTTAYSISIGERLTGLVQSGIVSKEEGVKLAPDIQVTLPKISEEPAVPGAPATPAATGGYVIKSGDTLSAIAKNAGISLNQLLELNPSFKANPNLIKPGQEVALATAAPTPTPVTPQATPGVIPQAPTTPPAVPKVNQPTPPAQPAPVQPTSTYAGSSIVDYLKSTGGDSSFAARKKLAGEKGMQNYTGTAEQNTELLKVLREQ